MAKSGQQILCFMILAGIPALASVRFPEYTLYNP